MRRFAVFFIIMSLFGVFPALPAAAAPEEGRADLLVRRLRQNPVQVTDNEPRAVPEGAAKRIEEALSKLGEPFFVVVGTSGMYNVDAPKPRDMIPLLHDRLRKDGIYLVVDSSANGEARQYGGSLPVDRAWLTARLELPYDADVVQHVELFTEILLSPDVNARIEARREAPKSAYQIASEKADRAETTALVAGAALSGLPLLAMMVLSLVRKKRVGR
jgi:hypothetical protein